MRSGFGWFGLAATTFLLVLVGVVAYNVGWSEGAAAQLPAGGATPYYGYGPHFFGAGFGFLWFFFVVFGFFWLLRFAFFGRRHWGHRHGWHGAADDEQMQAWHARAHGGPPPAPPSADAS
jgi:hypothetical protein